MNEPKVARRLIVTLYESGTLNVHDEDGRHSGGLTWGEVVEQITSMTHPRINNREPQYAMRTDAEWAERSKQIKQQEEV